MEHREPMRGGGLPRPFERLLGRRDNEEPIERELIEGILRHQQVADMRWIEASTKDADAHRGQGRRVIRDEPDRGARRPRAPGPPAAAPWWP